MTMDMHRRRWLQILGLACVLHDPNHLALQVHGDLLALTEPDALLAIDSGDMARIREH